MRLLQREIQKLSILESKSNELSLRANFRTPGYQQIRADQIFVWQRDQSS